MYEAFSLVLQVNHACNLRCTYCYTGDKFSRSMTLQTAKTAVDRALASLIPCGILDLGFFGGEPLIEARLIREILDYAREQAELRDMDLVATMTTNGTVTDPDAWGLLTDPGLNVSVSHDGLPELHDRHRVDTAGKGSSAVVERTLRRLVRAGRDFNVVVVIRPDGVRRLPDGIRHLHGLGVRRIEPSLDLWTSWSATDVLALSEILSECADLWRAGLPDYSISWFDEKLVRLSGKAVEETARCAYGDGQIAVAPSGALYPCERLIGEDRPDQAARLPGSVRDGKDFLCFPEPTPTTCEAGCPGAPVCGVTCRCSNLIRTGRPETPDELLCAVDRICFEETLRVLNLKRVVHDR